MAQVHLAQLGGGDRVSDDEEDTVKAGLPLGAEGEASDEDPLEDHPDSKLEEVRIYVRSIIKKYIK